MVEGGEKKEKKKKKEGEKEGRKLWFIKLVRGREMREEGGEIVEDLAGKLHRALRRKHEASVAEADRKRAARRGERDRTPAANRIRHAEHQRSRDEESVGARQGRLHR